MKYLTLTLRWACRLRVSFAVAGVGDIHCWIFVTQDDPSLTQHKKALQPLSLPREPTQKPCFPRLKTIPYDKLGLYFICLTYPNNQRSVFSPFLSQLSLVSLLLLLWPVVCSRVGGSQQPIFYHLFVINQEIFDDFIDLAWLISQRPIEYNYSVGVTPIELNIKFRLRPQI